MAQVGVAKAVLVAGEGALLGEAVVAAPVEVITRDELVRHEGEPGHRRPRATLAAVGPRLITVEVDGIGTADVAGKCCLDAAHRKLLGRRHEDLPGLLRATGNKAKLAHGFCGPRVPGGVHLNRALLPLCHILNLERNLCSHGFSLLSGAFVCSYPALPARLACLLRYSCSRSAPLLPSVAGASVCDSRRRSSEPSGAPVLTSP